MSYIEDRIRAALVSLGLVAGCSSAPTALNEGERTLPTPDAKRGEAVAHLSTPTLPLPPPGPVRNWEEVRLQAALRLVAANPNGTYMGAVVEPLLGIPVLEIELNGNGSVRRIVVLRHPQEARDTSRLAEEAVRRAAPFGDVSRLPKPWRFTETFLFNEERKFKPRSLDQ